MLFIQESPWLWFHETTLFTEATTLTTQAREAMLETARRVLAVSSMTV